MSSKTPQTIDELKQWYAERKLPPETVTRFFIGTDYREPKAFGIYRDEASGEYIVYKNKASGERAVRYQGTDEAHAVSEIYEKLKEEIRNRKIKTASGAVRSSGRPAGKKDYLNPFKLFGSSRYLSGCLSSIVWFITVLAAVIGLEVIFSDEPKDGYYSYSDTVYYHSAASYYMSELQWFKYDSSTDKWLFPQFADSMPAELRKKKTAKKYFLDESWNENITPGCTDFSKSVFYDDMQSDNDAGDKYFCFSNTYYYHMYQSYEKNWFVFDTEWKKTELRSLPEELQHRSLINEYAVQKSKALASGVTDFDNSVFYMDEHSPKTLSKGYYRYDDDMYYHLGENYDEDWYYYSDSGWESVSPKSLPEELQHNSLAGNYAYTDGWASDSYFDDFEETYFYSSYLDSIKKENDKKSWFDDDSDYDWGGDSWDFGDSDWDSDW